VTATAVVYDAIRSVDRETPPILMQIFFDFRTERFGWVAGVPDLPRH